MRSSPSIAPVAPDDLDVYLVLDDFGSRLGRAWRETNEERTDRCTLITDLIGGQYSDPARIIAFNTAEGWSRDVSAELADEIVQRSGMDGFDVSPSLQNFVAQHATTRPLQLPLPPTANRLAMSRKQLNLPPAVARNFARDMRAYHGTKDAIKRDDIAARQAWLLQQHWN